jgi:pimeloyl-ACP methyl ester carboxylesterase
MTPRVRETALPYATHKEENFRMVWYEWGAEDAPPVVCVHGLTRNGRDFDFLAERLAVKYRVIAPDMPGRGKSEWLKYAEEYALPVYAGYTLAWLPKLVQQPVHWVGTSMGGMLGMALAAQFPRMISSLTLNDVGALIPAAALKRLRKYVGKEVVFPSRAAAEAKFREVYTPFGITDERVWAHLFAHSFVEQPDGAVRLAYDPAIGKPFEAEPEPQDISLEALWEKVACPVLIIRGGESDVLPKDVADKMTAKPNARLYTVSGVGHAPMLADESETKLISDWLESTYK